MSITDILANAAAIVTVCGGGFAVIRFIRIRLQLQALPQPTNAQPNPPVRPARPSSQKPLSQGSSQTSTLQVIRQPSSTASMSAFKVNLDGKIIGNIYNGRSCTVDIQAGHHIVFVHAGSLSSPILPFDIAPNEKVTLFCKGDGGYWTTFRAASILLWRQK